MDILGKNKTKKSEKRNKTRDIMSHEQDYFPLN